MQNLTVLLAITNNVVKNVVVDSTKITKSTENSLNIMDMFAAMDTNKDGFLDESEMHHMMD
jgi:hypothetical protein